MPHAALYVVQLEMAKVIRKVTTFQCRTQHFMWCNSHGNRRQPHDMGFNAARSILCGATQANKHIDWLKGVSMPHAAFYVVQQSKEAAKKLGSRFQCRTQHFMWCNVLSLPNDVEWRFQCRTQHYMWCNNIAWFEQQGFDRFNAARSIICGATRRTACRGFGVTGFNAARSIICGATTTKC